MKSLFATIAVSVLLCAAPIMTLGLADNAEQQIRERHDRINQARLKGDVAAMNENLADDITLIAPDGRMGTKADILKWYQSDVKYDSLEDLESTVRIYGDTALLITTTKMTGQAFGKPFNAQIRDSLVFVKRDGKWVAVLHQMTRIVPSER
jgi:ketosteroid isomerase-like protein